MTLYAIACTIIAWAALTVFSATMFGRGAKSRAIQRASRWIEFLSVPASFLFIGFVLVSTLRGIR